MVHLEKWEMKDNAKLKTIRKYDDKTYKRLVFRVRKDDEKLYNWIMSKDSINGYILDLIKKDMEKNNI